MMHNNDGNSFHRRSQSSDHRHRRSSAGSSGGFHRRAQTADRAPTGSGDPAAMEFELDKDGIVMTREQIIERRMKRGECLTCPACPTKCFEIKRSIYNPVMNTKIPRTLEGVVYKGWCLLCHPAKDPRKKQRKKRSSRGGSGGLAREGRSSISPVSYPGEPSSTRSEIVASSAASPISGGNKAPSSMTELEGGNGRGGKKSRISRQCASRGFADSSFDDGPPNMRDQFASQTMQRSMPLIESNGVSEDEGEDDDDSDSTSGVDTVTTCGVYTVTKQESNDECKEELKETNIDDFVADFGLQLGEIAENGQEQSGKSYSTLGEGSSRSLGLDKHSNECDQGDNDDQVDTLHAEDVEKLQNLSSLISALAPPGENSSENDAVIIDMVSNFLLDELESHVGEGKRLPSVDLAVFCVTKLWESARKSEENKDAIVYSNGLDAIIQAMFLYAKKDPTIQERGCGALWSLAVHPKNRSPIALAGGCHRVTDAMSNHISCESVQTMALGAIKAFSADRDGRASLESRGTSRVIVRTMKAYMKNHSIQAEGCAILSNLAVDTMTNQVSVASKDEMLTILEAMNAHSMRPNVQKMAIFVMKNYTFSETNVKTLSKCPDAHKLICWSSKQYHDECGEDAKVVLDRLKEFKKEKRARAVSPRVSFDDTNEIDEEENAAYEKLMRISLRSSSDNEAVNGIIDMMLEKPCSVKIQSGGLQSLWTLARKNDTNKDAIAMSHRTLDAMFSAMNEKKLPNAGSNTSIQERGCGVILSLAESGPINRLRLIHYPDNTCVKALWHAIEHYIAEESVQAMALGACRALLVEEDFQTVAKETDGVRLMGLSMRVHHSSRLVQREGKASMMKLHEQMSSRHLLNGRQNSSTDGSIEEINVLLDSLSANR